MPQRSHTTCTMRRRLISPELSSVRFFTVRARRSPIPRLTVLGPFVRFIPGILVVLFFQCMAALFNPANRRREGVRWSLASYAVAMFSFGTVLTGMGLDVASISFIDNREFPGVMGVLPPGPLGYQWFIRPTVLSIIPNLMFFLNNWLAEGLLVGPLFDHALTRLTPTPPPALSLLRNLLREPMGHLFPQPHVSCLPGCGFRFPTTLGEIVD